MGTDDLFKKRRAERQKRKHEFKSVNTNSFLIVTEGEKTEPLYFKGLQKKINEKVNGRIDIVESPVIDGIALKEDSIQVCLHEVKVSICSPSIEEENVNYNEQTGKYYYSIINGLPVEFEKDELIEFLYNERKVIKVTAKVSIQVNEIPVGTVFTGRSVHE